MVVVVLEVEHGPDVDLRQNVVERAAQLVRHAALTTTGATVLDAAAVVHPGMTAPEYIATLRHLAKEPA